MDRRLYNSWSSTVSETWRSTYNFNSILRSLSKPMKTVLKDSMGIGKICNCSKGTRQALIERNLFDKNGNLTNEGKVLAVSISPLKRQVKELNLKINTLEYGLRNTPKLKFNDYLKKFYDYSNPDHYKVIVSSESFPKIRST